jgi:hypothetical protein
VSSSFGSLEAGTSLPVASGEGSSPLGEGVHDVRREIHVISYPRNAARMGTCVACGEREQIQGELLLIEEGRHKTTAPVGKCQEWVFETLNLTAEQARKKVEMALAGDKVCDEE